MEHKTFAPGEVIFSEGDESQEAYHILRGGVRISMQTEHGPLILSELGPHEIFGEMGMVDDRPRNATATAFLPTEVEVIHEHEFFDVVLSDPNRMRPYLATVFERLRATDLMLQIQLNSQVTEAGAPALPVEAALVPQPAINDPDNTEAPLSARLVSENTDERFKDEHINTELDKFPFKIGRRYFGQDASVFSQNDLYIRDEKPFRVSRNHCVIERHGSSLFVRDRGSTLGTVVNDELLIAAHGKVVQELKRGENTLILGGPESPHHFRLTVH